MAFIPTPDAAQANIRYLFDGQEVQNTLSFVKQGGFLSGDFTDLATELASAWAANVMPLISNAVVLREVNVVDQSSATGPSISLPVVPNIPGGQSSPALPNSVALAVSLRSTGRGRSSRGRIFLPGLVESQVSANAITLALADQVTAAVDNVRTALGALGFDMVVISREANGVPRLNGLPFPIVAVVVVDPVVDSQRRRLPKRGR